MVILDLKNNYFLLTGFDTLLDPVMRETIPKTCRCGSNSSCNCVHSKIGKLPTNGVVGLPLDFNFPALMYSASNGPMNQFQFQVLPHDLYKSEIYAFQPPKSPNGICIDKRIEPISPPISTSSPLNATENKNDKFPAKKFVCKECNKSFDYKHVLQNHCRTHTGEKPYNCNICGKKFTRDHHLKTHMRLHTGEKPFCCQYCKMRFVQVANLRRHIRVHTGERPYACDLCPCRFPDTNQLKAHVLTHTSDKPFTCDLCNGQYRRKHHLNKHKCPSKYTDDGVMDMDDCKSDDAGSNDSLNSVNNGYHQPIHIIRGIPEALNLSTYITTIPMQTEPEDLSVRKHRSANNNNSSSASSRSTSPLDEPSSPMNM